MFIAHLPAGYLASRLHPMLVPLTVPLLVGSVLPDVDLLWFYLVDGRAYHHHGYLPHRPMVWAAGLLLAWRHPYLAALSAGALLHLVLDSLLGSIAWAWPFHDTAGPLVVVPPTHKWWVMSFLTHWTFLIELAICAIAAAVRVRQRHLLLE